MAKSKVDKGSSSRISGQGNDSAWRLFYIAGICVVTCLLYLRTLDYGFVLDDAYYYVENTVVQKGVKAIPQIFSDGSLNGYYRHEAQQEAYGAAYRPLTLSTFALQHQLVGINAKAGHLMNILLAMMNGILLFSLLRRLFSSWPVHLSGTIALLFVAHPVHTEVVCNIKSRDELLAGFFILLSLRNLLNGAAVRTERLPIAPALIFLCALFSKESSIAFIAAVPLLLHYSGKSGWKSHARAIVPFLTVAGVFLAARYLAVGTGSSASGDRILYNTLYAAQNASELWGTKLSILLQFLKQGIFPYMLSYDYSYNQLPVTDFLSFTALFSLGLHLLLGFLVVRGIPHKDPIALGLALFFIASIVTNNLLFSIGSTFAERFLYLPVAGLLLAVAAAISKLRDRLFADRRYRYILPAIAVHMMLVFFTIASERVPVWADNSTLYRSGLMTSPRSARVHFDVGSDMLAVAGTAVDPNDRLDLLNQAERELRKSVEILPEYTEALYNLSVLSIQRGDTTGAISGYKKTLATDSAHRPSLINTAYLYLMRSETDSSLVYLNKLMRIYPNDNDGFLNLSYLYYLEKDTVRAQFFANEGMRLYPEVADHYRNMAAACLLAGDSVEARKYLDQFLYRGDGR